MRRAVFLLLVAVSCVGCNAAGAGFGRWATGPQRIPPPPTGSFGQPATTSPYYQSRAPQKGSSETASTQVSPIGSAADGHTRTPPVLTTSQTPELSPAAVTGSGAAAGLETAAGLKTIVDAGSTGWRSPRSMIQRATAEESLGHISGRHDTSLRNQVNAGAFPNRSVLANEPNDVIEPRIAHQSASVVIQPMVTSGTVLETSEPRRLELPGQLTEITNLPLVGQSVAVASGELQEAALPATTSGNGLENGPQRGQWRQSDATPR
jgi:hypothetical protein